MGTITVREATGDDFDALLRLLDGMDESMYAGRGHAVERDVRSLYDSVLADPGQRLLVAEDGGRLVGSAHLMVLRHFGRSLPLSGVVEGVVVDPAYRRAGVGAALMRAVAEAARRAGCYKLALTSNLARTGAHRFYSRLGWKRSHFGYSLEL
ncbi:MAG: GNAT family N-acetyltransferase [Dehalococcoidia bacterium]|nr:GNAT family N-acetyltransferase [Dehalococcoidia bacterium]